MIDPRIRSIQDVAEKHLCEGCGTCAFIQPDVISMVDVPDQGRRPLVLHVNGKRADTRAALACCSGTGYGHDGPPVPDVIPELTAGWGPVLEVWEGYASDPEVRFAGSSGGVATALALHAIEAENLSGVLHISARKDVPYLNETVYSTTREDLMAATGSRYAPASPCERLDLVESAPTASVLIGKPCDIGGAALARAQRPTLDEKLGLTIAIFCAGTPTTQGTLEMIKAAGVTDAGEVSAVRYRGNGWPGRAEIRWSGSGQSDKVRSFTYEESWGDILQKHRQWRCHVCADHTGEMADVSVGDPWYRPTGGNPGRSLVLVRTERGRAVVRRAVEVGALTLERVDASTLPASQMNLLRTRGSVWGRSLALRLALLPAPKFHQMPTFRFWWRELTPRAKAQSTIGTLVRIRRKHLRQRVVMNHQPGRADDGPSRRR
jgi:coenzyme F420 hydrogenase subunit beta